MHGKRKGSEQLAPTQPHRRCLCRCARTAAFSCPLSAPITGRNQGNGPSQPVPHRDQSACDFSPGSKRFAFTSGADNPCASRWRQNPALFLPQRQTRAGTLSPTTCLSSESFCDNARGRENGLSCFALPATKRGGARFSVSGKEMEKNARATSCPVSDCQDA